MPTNGFGFFLEETFSSGTVHFYITADISANAVGGNTFAIAAPVLDNFGIADPKNKTGVPFGGSTISILSTSSSGIVSGSAISSSGTGFDFSRQVQHSLSVSESILCFLVARVLE